MCCPRVFDSRTCSETPDLKFAACAPDFLVVQPQVAGFPIYKSRCTSKAPCGWPLFLCPLLTSKEPFCCQPLLPYDLEIGIVSDQGQECSVGGFQWPLVFSQGWTNHHPVSPQRRLGLLETLMDVWLWTLAEHCWHCGARAHR